MFGQNRSAVVVLYLLAGGFVLLVGRWAFVYYQVSTGALVPDLSSSARSVTVARPLQNRDRSSPSAQRRALQRLAELQLALQQSDGLLREQTTLLNHKEAECRALRQELDASIAFVFSVLGEAGNSDVTDASLTGQRQQDLAAELQAFRSTLESSAAAQQQQLEQLAELQAQLESAELELAEMELAANQEVVLLERQKRELETVTRDMMVQFGPLATPALTALLADERSHVRAWAATALGELGMDAEEAVPFLVELLADPDLAVSNNARTALARIEP